MKRILRFIFIFLPLFSWGQDRELEINYIAHDHFNNAILNKVEEIYNISAYNNNRNTYLYLANTDNPIILKCDPNQQQEFEDFQYEISCQLKHNVWPEVDIKKIFELLKEDDFIDDDGNPRYDFFTLNFYITSSFWSYSYHETLSARLFWDLELSEKNNVQINIYRPENDRIKYDEKLMFGPKKLNGDYKVYMFTY